MAYLDTLSMGKACLHQFQRSIYIYLMIGIPMNVSSTTDFSVNTRKVQRSCLLVISHANLYRFRKMEKVY